MKILLSFLLFFISLACTKEYSDQRSFVPITNVDTSRYIITFDTTLTNNNETVSIDIETLRKPEPYWWGFENLGHIDDSLVYRYIMIIDVTWLMQYLDKGDTAQFRMAVIYKVNGIPNFRKEYSDITHILIKK